MRRFPLALLIAVALFKAQSADSYEYIGAVWPDWMVPVPYCVNVNDIPIGQGGYPIMTQGAFAWQVQSALQQWQTAADGWISFHYQGFCSNSPWDDYDGVNTIGWGSLVDNTIGRTAPKTSYARYLRAGAFGEIFESDILIDTRLAQSYEDPTYFIEVILPYILVHEAGHFAGLGHSEVECSVMAPSGIGYGMCQDDLDAIRSLYPPR